MPDSGVFQRILDAALFQYMEKDYAEAVGELLDRGAVFNINPVNGVTFLHRAVERGSINTVELLLDRGFDINAMETVSGTTPLHYAVQYSRRQDLAELLLARGADVNSVDKNGRTPLYLSLMYGSDDYTGILLQNGAKDLKCKSGKTALDMARIRGFDATVALLSRAQKPGRKASPGSAFKRG